MSNMGHCRFHNTNKDLRDCYQHMSDDLSADEDESEARKDLIELCVSIAERYGEEEEDARA